MLIFLCACVVCCDVAHAAEMLHIKWFNLFFKVSLVYHKNNTNYHKQNTLSNYFISPWKELLDEHRKKVWEKHYLQKHDSITLLRGVRETVEREKFIWPSGQQTEC